MTARYSVGLDLGTTNSALAELDLAVQPAGPFLWVGSSIYDFVEARHAAYLNLLNGQLAAPDSFDTAKSMAAILAIAGPFIKAC